MHRKEGDVILHKGGLLYLVLKIGFQAESDCYKTCCSAFAKCFSSS